jgi:SagB-type dehydrogenase family enzyme
MAARILLLLLRDIESSIKGLTPGVRAALTRLAHGGAPEEELQSQVVESDGVTALPLLYFTLNSLARRGALAYRVMGDHGALATATSPQLLTLRDPVADAPRALSRFALLRRDDGQLVFETSLSAARIIVEDNRVLALAARLPSSDLSPDETSALVTLFDACGMFATDGENQRALAYWNFHDLLFHARTRFGRNYPAWGGLYPFRGRTESPPVVKPAMSEEVVPLDRPSRPDAFTVILDERHSSRDFGDPPITRRQLGEFLYRSARVRGTYDAGTGQQLSSRPYPGGGAVYELEIYATVRDCVDLPSGLYHYCPLDHRLARLGDAPDALLQKATQPPHSPPQVLLTITARFGRIFWKYEAMGYALILKDTGALMQTFYLTAQAMGLGACAIGGGDSDLFAAAAGLDYYAETSVGEFVVGTRSERDA